MDCKLSENAKAFDSMFPGNPLQYPYASKRHVVYAKNGMTCAGNPHSASVGLQMLLAGGNAVDAAVAMAAAYPLFEPTGNGLGADCFAIVWHKGKIYGINGSGPAPKAVTIEAMLERAKNAERATDKEKAGEKIPSYGVLPIDVPGAVGAWTALHERFGRLSFQKVLEPAIRYAEEGYPVSPNIARWWKAAYMRYEPYIGLEAFDGFFDTFMKKSRTWYMPGDIFKCPDMAKTLRAIAATKGEAFYRGELAETIDRFMKKTGGFLTKEDLAAYQPEWVEPVSVNYHGVDVWELPPNGQGITVLMALKMLSCLPQQPEGGIEAIHQQIEAVKLALADGGAYLGEPSSIKVDIEKLLSDEYAAERASSIGEEAIDAKPGIPGGCSTVYFAAADGEGNMVSMIQSNYRGFGSGIIVPGTGISLNDRAECFSLSPEHPNALGGGKRPYHTIIPGFLTKDGEPLGPFGIMGGLMQPQAHVQVLQRLIDRNFNPQSALDAPRWQWTSGKKVTFEQGFPNHLLMALKSKGHEVTVDPDGDVMGRGQIILRNSKGILCGGTEMRTDGQIMGY